MNNALLKLNIIQTHNKMIRQKEDEKAKEEKFKKLYLQYKNTIENSNLTKDKIILDLNNKIRNLESNNLKLKNENNYYNEVIGKIPKIIIKILKIY